jgi:ABC-2 type transport system permease protein
VAGVRPSRVWAFAAYEIRRALARKKVLAMVAFIVLLDVAGYYIFAASAPKFIPAQLYPYLWTAGALALFPLFIQFVAILIAAGAMSEEYEAGTAELLLAKPVSRTEFFVGKFLGGYVLLSLLIILNVLLSAAVATLTFGAQAGLSTIPGIVVVEIFSSALFFSVAFTLGELVRRSSLAYILSSALVVASQIVGTYLSFAYELTGNAFYSTIHAYLPTTIAGSLPPQYEQPFLPSEAGRIFELILGSSSGVPSEATAAILIAAYFVVAVSVALAYFSWADVSRRVG